MTSLRGFPLSPIDNGKFVTGFYDKREDSSFLIVNLPFFSSNIPSALAYGVYVFQLVVMLKPVANIKILLIAGSCSPIICCHRVNAKGNMCQ